MMARYIDADKLFRYVDEQTHLSKGKLQNYIRENNTADVEQVKHGEWKQGIPYICSKCGKPAPTKKNTDIEYSCWLSPFCPHCGAKMDGGKVE